MKSTSRKKTQLRIVDPETIILNHNVDAEAQLLINIIEKERHLDDALKVGLEPKHFYNMHNRRIFQTMLEMRENGWAIDLCKLGEIIKGQGFLDAIGGAGYLQEFLNEQPRGASSGVSNAKVIIESYRLRELRMALMRIESAAREPGSRLFEEIYAEAIEYLVTVGRDTGYCAMQNIGPVIEDQLHEIEMLYSGAMEERIFPTGIYGLDELLNGGLYPKTMMLIPAYTSVGKTAIVLDILTNMARRGIHCALFSLEITENLLGGRMLASESGINLRRVLRPTQLDGEDMEYIREAWKRIETVKSRILIDFASNVTTDDIYYKLKAAKRADPKLDVFLIDYLQILSPSRKKKKRYHTLAEEIAAASWQIRVIAKTLDMVAIVPCQVNEAVRGRKTTELFLDDIKDSKQAGKNADVVTMLYYHGFDQIKRDKAVMTLKVEKSNRGPTGECQIIYDKACQKFESYYEGAEEVPF